MWHSWKCKLRCSPCSPCWTRASHFARLAFNCSGRPNSMANILRFTCYDLLAFLSLFPQSLHTGPGNAIGTAVFWRSWKIPVIRQLEQHSKSSNNSNVTTNDRIWLAQWMHFVFILELYTFPNQLTYHWETDVNRLFFLALWMAKQHCKWLCCNRLRIDLMTTWVTHKVWHKILCGDTGDLDP